MSEHTADIDARQGRPLGPASGGDQGFWDRLGVDEGGLPVHLPMGVNERGQGPEDDSAAYTFVCWCGDVECPLTLALGHAWASGRHVIPPAAVLTGRVCTDPDCTIPRKPGFPMHGPHDFRAKS